MTSMIRLELQKLAVPSDQPRVTIYHPLKNAGTGAATRAELLRDVLEIAERQLVQFGLNLQEARRYLRVTRRMANSGGTHQSGSAATIALFASADSVRTELLPYHCPPAVEVGHHWHLTPLMRLLTWPVEFHLVAFTQGRVSLYRGTREKLTQAALPITVPPNPNDRLRPTGDECAIPLRNGESSGQAWPKRSVIDNPIGRPGITGNELSMHVNAVARGTAQYVSLDPLPIVVAAEDALQSAFRLAYEGTELAEPGICGDPGRLTRTELHRQAVNLIDAHYESELRSARDRFQRIAETAEVSRLLEEIVPAACQGRVNSVIAAFGQRIWGTWDPVGQMVVVLDRSRIRQSGTTDLLDLALRETLRHGGDVKVVAPEFVPDSASLAAVLRW